MIVGIQSEILKIHSLGLLDRLLADKTTKSHILWATDAYQDRGSAYQRDKEITPELITGENSGIIKNRARKALEQQSERTKQRGEVFTPLWVCARMNDELDTAWFGGHGKNGDRGLFFQNGQPTEQVIFPKSKKWWRYVDNRRLEITCGEAPYLVSRYDVSTGESIPIENRIGILDRKLRIVNENTSDEAEWMKWAIRAYQSTYGYEFQGDNLVIARVNLLMTFVEYLQDRWKRTPTDEEYRIITKTIAWNIWQMDGLTGTIPYCKADEEFRQMNIFEWFGSEEYQEEANRQPHCRIYDWRRNNSLEYTDVNTGGRNMKFDFITGNPPYQDESVGEQKTYAPPIYHQFIDGAVKVADVVELIHPARFLFNAGSTPKAWNQKMLNDPHFKVLYYEKDAGRIFSNTEIKGGVAITYYDNRKEFGTIGTFSEYTEMNDIREKIEKYVGFVSFASIVISRTSYRLTDKMHADHPEAIGQLSKGHAYDMSTNILERLPQIFFEEKPEDGLDYIQIVGRINNERTRRFIRRDYVNNVINLDKFTIFLPKANGRGDFGEVLSSPIIAEPSVGSTETFVGIGAFDSEIESKNALKYVQTKFTRALLGILKKTQDITPDKFKFVPLQDFTPASDIDWSKSIPEIDQQLYAKYGLDKKEIEFIETHVKEMA